MNRADYHLQRSQQFYELERFESCYKEAKEVLKYEPENEGAFFLMLLALIQLEKYEEAEQIGKTALATHPDADQLYYAMGVLCNRIEDYGSARECLEAAIRLNPMNSFYFFQLAKTHLNFNQVKRAENLINHSLELNPNNEAALQLKSLIEQQTGKNETAHIIADKALKLSPEDAQAHIVKATLFWQNKNFEKVEAHLESAVQLNPQHQELLALWLESKTRNIPKWKTPINLMMGKSQTLVWPSLILGIITFLPNVLLANEIELIFVFWVGIILLLIPCLVFWWVRPYLKFSFLNKKFNWTFFEMANPSLPIEMLASLNIISSIIYWISGNGIFFGMAFLSTLIGVGIAQIKNMESYYPIFKHPIRTGGIYVFGVLVAALVLFFLNELGN